MSNTDWLDEFLNNLIYSDSLGAIDRSNKRIEAKQAIQALITQYQNALIDRLLEQAERLIEEPDEDNIMGTKIAVPVEAIKAERRI